MNSNLKLSLAIFFFLISASLLAQKTQNTSSNTKQLFKELIDSSYIYYSSGNYKKSMDINMEILSKAQKINDPYYIRTGYRYLGYDYIALGDTLMAKENFEKSEKYAKLSTNDTVKAITYMDLANFYSTFNAKGYLRKSIDYHEKSISLLEKIKDTLNLAVGYANAADTYLKAGDLNEAYRHLVKAQKYSSFVNNKFVKNNASLDAGIELLFGQYFFKKEKYFQADEHLYNCINLSRSADLDSDLMDAYKTLSESRIAQGKYQEAYKNRLLYEEYKTKKDKERFKIDTDAAVAQFQVDEYRKDAKAAELHTQLQTEIAINKSQQSYILMIVTTCALVIVVVFFFTFRRRKQLVKELRIKNKEYLEAKEEMEQLAKSKSNFFSTVSHELRTPLYGVIGLSTILLEDESLKKHREDLKSLKFSANYLMALINDVLQINKIDAKSLEEEETEFNVGELINIITTSFEYIRLQNKNEINVKIGSNVPVFIKGNATRLSQILMNLIGNACKFTENGTISAIVNCVECSENKSTLSFRIEDTGIGIAQEKQEMVFEEFSQGEIANYNYQGTGLGLPIVKKLLTLANSSIHLESELGKGSIFSFQLTYELASKSLIEIKDPKSDPIEIKGKRILIVEDNRINQIVTKKILEKNEIICTIAENGEEAIKIIKNKKFDLVLMDINMPIKNGLEATKEIRMFNKTLPIIALTAVEVEEMRYEIYESGMNDIIVKPYDVTKFMKTISKNIKGNAQSTSKNREESLRTGT